MTNEKSASHTEWLTLPTCLAPGLPVKDNLSNTLHYSDGNEKMCGGGTHEWKEMIPLVSVQNSENPEWQQHIYIHIYTYIYIHTLWCVALCKICCSHCFLAKETKMCVRKKYTHLQYPINASNTYTWFCNGWFILLRHLTSGCHHVCTYLYIVICKEYKNTLFEYIYNQYDILPWVLIIMSLVCCHGNSRIE